MISRSFVAHSELFHPCLSLLTILTQLLASLLLTANIALDLVEKISERDIHNPRR